MRCQLRVALVQVPIYSAVSTHRYSRVVVSSSMFFLSFCLSFLFFFIFFFTLPVLYPPTPLRLLNHHRLCIACCAPR